MNKYNISMMRSRKVGDLYLVTSDDGSWVSLKEKDFSALVSGKLKENSKIFKMLEKNNMISTKNDYRDVIKALQKRYLFLFQGPSLHIVIPTLRCNLKCIYCHASSKPINEKGFDMDKKTAKEVIDFIFQSPSHCITIEFQGGEPLLNFEVVKYIIEYATILNKKFKKDLLFSLVSNLIAMDYDKLDYLIKNNVGICTSLDGPKEIHDFNRVFSTKKGSYELTVKWIKKIKEEYRKRGLKNKKMNALLTITRKSLGKEKDIVNEYIKQGLEGIHLRFLNNLGNAQPIWNEISCSSEEFLDFWRKGVDYVIECYKKGCKIKEKGASIIIKKIMGIDPHYLDLRSPCGAAIGQVCYNHNGDIYTCDEARMIGEDIFKIGNVKQGYQEVFMSDQVASIISASVNDTQICDSCVYKPYCGICPVCNYVEQGSIICNILKTPRCKVHMAQFDHIFRRILSDKSYFKVLLDWAKTPI